MTRATVLAGLLAAACGGPAASPIVNDDDALGACPLDDAGDVTDALLDAHHQSCVDFIEAECALPCWPLADCALVANCDARPCALENADSVRSAIRFQSCSALSVRCGDDGEIENPCATCLDDVCE